ncbi:MAG: GDSL-type esterase/lipase family protein [Verrucomicrobiota bacterium]
MKRLLFIAVIAAAIAWFFLGKRDSGGYVNLPPTATGEWVAFGDSLTSGYGASKGHDYPTLLAKRLDVKIQNHGAPGRTTAGGLEKLDGVVALKPRVVLLCLGGNDGLNQLPREAMFKNLETMIDRFHRAGSFVVLIGVRSSTLRDKNADGFEDLADKKRVLLVPNILDGVLANPALMSDQIHPNDAGYEKIAGRIEDELLPVLSKLR